MNLKRTILNLFFIILCIVLLYNYLIAPLIWQYGAGMGMGMHGRMYNNFGYYIDIRNLLLLIIVIAGFLVFALPGAQNKRNKCSRCGYDITDERWKICPICGTTIRDRKGDRK